MTTGPTITLFGHRRTDVYDGDRLLNDGGNYFQNIGNMCSEPTLERHTVTIHDCMSGSEDGSYSNGIVIQLSSSALLAIRRCFADLMCPALFQSLLRHTHACTKLRLAGTTSMSARSNTNLIGVALTGTDRHGTLFIIRWSAEVGRVQKKT